MRGKTGHEWLQIFRNLASFPYYSIQCVILSNKYITKLYTDYSFSQIIFAINCVESHKKSGKHARLETTFEMLNMYFAMQYHLRVDVKR